jgi:clan AA aspartic protease
MGLVQASIQLTNSWDLENVRRGLMDKDEVRSIYVNMLVDTGSIYLCINESVCEQLGLSVQYQKKCQTADGRVVEFDIVGPVRVKFKNRECMVDAMLLPGDCECLFGAIPMEAMDVLVSPQRGELIVNPEHPNFAVVRI